MPLITGKERQQIGALVTEVRNGKGDPAYGTPFVGSFNRTMQQFFLQHLA